MLNTIHKKSRKKLSTSGMAVIMVMAVVLLLVTVALELHLNERNNLLNAAAMRDRVMLSEMVKSGVHMAQAILVKDRLESEADSLQEDWADEQTMAALIETIPFERGELQVTISDELGKIQINALVEFPEGREFDKAQYQLWENFSNKLFSVFELIEDAEDFLEETDSLTIINSLIDWLDSGDDEAITGLSGAESDYYEDLDPPYRCKNGPFDHLSEVQLVKGITPALFDGFGGLPGIGASLTTYGAAENDDEKFSFPGKININTAELPVLTAMLPSDSSDFAELLIDYRNAVDGTQYINDLTKTDWYKGVPGFGSIKIDPELITVSSDIFRIVALAKIDNIQSSATVIVRREKEKDNDPWRCKVLNWKNDYHITQTDIEPPKLPK
jgi:general secretion pathway protein K